MFSKKFKTAAVFPLFAALTACQTLRPPTLPTLPPTELLTTPTTVAAITPTSIHFSITGKIGVRTAKQSGSAFYAWSQDGERFAIDLTGALGIGQTHIQGIPDHVTLQSAKTGLIEASTPEELLERATGWQAPISYLPYWIDGQSANADSAAKRDMQNRLQTLNEGGWDVVFNYDDQSQMKYPNRLVMNQIADPTDPTTHNKVTLTIQREAAPTIQTTQQSTAP
ncbi:MAG: outer membrane lipoprotein LolB [Candidatus Saccharibacteria bacterium]|nr:outer membrane lipoprotein LolB [Moraxellaceae bacterium]